jgi:hypothetical protein
LAAKDITIGLKEKAADAARIPRAWPSAWSKLPESLRNASGRCVAWSPFVAIACDTTRI